MVDPHFVIDTSKLTAAENRILKLTAELWNSYCELPKQHPSDDDEFLSALHGLQYLIGIRGIRVRIKRKSKNGQ